MSSWDKTSKRPVYFTDPEQRRRVIGTQHGWVLRRNFTEAGTNAARTKDELLVPIAEAGVVNFGAPKIVEMYSANTSGGETIKSGANNYLYVVYNQPVKRLAGTLDLVLANTSGGAANTHATNLVSDPVINANNTLRFTFAPPAAGTYKVGAQTLANSAANSTKSLNTGLTAANLAIDGATSNTYGVIVVS